MEDAPFEIGDVVRLKNGWTPMKVMDVEFRLPRHKHNSKRTECWCIRALYPSQERWSGESEEGWENWRKAEDYQLYEEGNEDMEDMEENTGVTIGTLFQVKGEETYGTYLTTNSQGQFVLEMKGRDGEVKAYAPDSIEEVVPYTVAVRKVVSDKATRGPVHWQVKPDILQKGDLLVDGNGTRYVVQELDSKSKRSTKRPDGLRKILTEPIAL